ncbi:hypothetical protein [Microlunatus speluncae]|uniref:hypothetical protein n=1 Tax=Microlunatus speluncae TaxID=2594267 RepID=UPI001266148C|nr:hypothetical protein [Microlunatus speluncae]
MIALVTIVVGLLAGVGVVFLVFGDSFDDIRKLLQPIGASGPGGTVDLGHGVTVTVPDGWAIVDSTAEDSSSKRMERGLSMVLGHTSTSMILEPAELCDSQIRTMAGQGITNATFSGASTVLTSGGATAVQCEVTGTATGMFGSGPIGLRYVVARTEDGLTGALSLHYKPGSTKDQTLQDYDAMVDSMWKSMLD